MDGRPGTIENALIVFGSLPVAAKILVGVPIFCVVIFLFGVALTIHFIGNHEDPEIEGRSKIDTLFRIFKLGLKGSAALLLYIVPGVLAVFLFDLPGEIGVPIGVIFGLILLFLVYLRFG